MEALPRVKPRLRGVSHQYAFFVSVLFGAVLVVAASGAREGFAATAFAGALTAMFGTRALYHRLDGRGEARGWTRRVASAGSYLLIAGT